MSTTLQLEPLTEILLTQLAATGFPVGDGMMPPGAWWGGQTNLPGTEAKPFTVLTSLAAGRSSGSFADSQSDWQIPYAIESYGVTRAQCQWMADKARLVIGELQHELLQLGEDTYYVQQVRVDTINPVSARAITDPPVWFGQDGISVWLSKELP